MPIMKGEDAEKEGVEEVAKLMLVSARTAPKSGGVDDIQTLLAMGEEKDALAVEMEKVGGERNIDGFKRDGRNVRDSQVVVLIGIRGTKKFGLNCGACGYRDCREFEEVGKKMGQDFIGPNCFLKALDMGIALGSAAKIAMELNVDNRIMYRIGVAAKRLGLLPESSVVMGIPLSAKGKSIYFDRPTKVERVPKGPKHPRCDGEVSRRGRRVASDH
jgi:uncharacterized ferredoxin-like protein